MNIYVVTYAENNGPSRKIHTCPEIYMSREDALKAIQEDIENSCEIAAHFYKESDILSGQDEYSSHEWFVQAGATRKEWALDEFEIEYRHRYQ